MQLNHNIWAQNDNQLTKYLIQIDNKKELYIGDDFINQSNEIVRASDNAKILELHSINTVFAGLTKCTTSSDYKA